MSGLKDENFHRDINSFLAIRLREKTLLTRRILKSAHAFEIFPLFTIFHGSSGIRNGPGDIWNIKCLFCDLHIKIHFEFIRKKFTYNLLPVKIKEKQTT